MTKVNSALLTTINKYGSSKEEVRYYLNGVCLDISENGSAFMVATDGFKLLFAPFQNADIPSGRYIVPRKLIENIKPKKNDKSDIGITISGDDISLVFDGATFTGKLIDGTFPDWRRVIPESQSGEPGRFNGAHLKDLEDAAKAVGVKRALVGFNGWNPCWVQFPGTKLSGVVMPSIKSESPDPIRPNFS